jgi:hypothetical protein
LFGSWYWRRKTTLINCKIVHEEDHDDKRNERKQKTRKECRLIKFEVSEAVLAK